MKTFAQAMKQNETNLMKWSNGSKSESENKAFEWIIREVALSMKISSRAVNKLQLRCELKYKFHKRMEMFSI